MCPLEAAAAFDCYRQPDSLEGCSLPFILN
jgi:hypothetical protein